MIFITFIKKILVHSLCYLSMASGGYGRGGRGALLLQALSQPPRKPGDNGQEEDTRRKGRDMRWAIFQKKPLILITLIQLIIFLCISLIKFIINMPDNYEKVFKSPINTSIAKNLYSFTKSDRF